MFDVQLEGDTVIIKVDLIFTKFNFPFKCPNDWSANLLAQKIEERQLARMLRIKKQAYAAGYRDGRAKRKRTEWFWNGFKPDVQCSDGKTPGVHD